MRLLLIEDDIKFSRLLKKALEAEGYAVDHFLEGRKGLDQAIMEEYDAGIIDIGLPDISGLEVVKALRENENTLPVIFLTALGQTKDKITGLDSGADDYLVKPVELGELLARIRSVLRRPSHSDPLIYSYDSLVVDTTRREVSRNGRPIDLSIREYALLDYLIRNAGRALSRQDLLDHVWDGSVDPFTKTIDVYIGYLRNKVDRAFPKDKPLIQTVKGIGYKLEAS